MTPAERVFAALMRTLTGSALASELAHETRLSRGEVECALAELAVEGRVARALLTEDSKLKVRWSARR